MKIIRNSGGIASTNAYIVADEFAEQAVIFDAPNDTVSPMLDEVARQGWQLIGLWLTHGHFDHLADHAVVTNRFPDAKVLIHRLDEPKLRQPGSAVFPLPFTIPPGNADAYLEDGQTLAIGSLHATVIHTPGHSPGHVMFHFAEHKFLIGGDLIIMGGVGRTDLPDASHADLEESIRTVMKLPDDTQILGGHGQPSTIGEERRNNLGVRSALK